MESEAKPMPSQEMPPNTEIKPRPVVYRIAADVWSLWLGTIYGILGHVPHWSIFFVVPLAMIHRAYRVEKTKIDLAPRACALFFVAFALCFSTQGTYGSSLLELLNPAITGVQPSTEVYDGDIYPAPAAPLVPAQVDWAPILPKFVLPSLLLLAWIGVAIWRRSRRMGPAPEGFYEGMRHGVTWISLAIIPIALSYFPGLQWKLPLSIFLVSAATVSVLAFRIGRDVRTILGVATPGIVLILERSVALFNSSYTTSINWVEFWFGSILAIAAVLVSGFIEYRHRKRSRATKPKNYGAGFKTRVTGMRSQWTLWLQQELSLLRLGEWWKAQARRTGYGALVLLSLTAYVWFCSGLAAAERDARVMYAKLEAEGTPLNTDDFVKSFAVPDDQNAAEQLMPILERLKKQFDSLSNKDKDVLRGFVRASYKEVDLVSIKNQRRKATLSETQAVFLKLAPELDKLAGATTRPYFILNKDWVDGKEILIPESAVSRNAVKLITFRAMFNAKTGNRRAAIQDIKTALKLSEYAGQTPTTIHMIVRAAAESITRRAILDCIQLDPQGASSYSQLLKNRPQIVIARYMRAEAYIAISYWRDYTLKDMQIYPGSPQLTFYFDYTTPTTRTSGLPTDPIVRAFVGRMLVRYDGLLSGFNRDGTVKTGVDIAARWRSIEGEMEKSSTPLDILSLATVLTGERLLTRNAVLMASTLSVQALGQVVDFHNRTGKWPKTLAEAGANYPDPFSKGKESLLYRVTSKDVRVWSRGENHVDDGGLLREEITDTEYPSEKREDVFRFVFLQTSTNAR